MKKKMSVLLALSMLVLTACSGKSAPQTTAAPQTESAAAGTESSDKTEAAGGEQVEIADSYTWTVAMNVAETTLNYKMMDKFKELIEAKSGGKITLNLYANGQLGNDPDLETMRKVLDDESFVDTLNRDSATTNVRMMGMADAGFRQTTSNKEIHSVADFSGLKIRVIQNPYHIAYWQSLGANALAMDFSEVYVGLQQKTIDAQENPYMNIVSNKFYETQDYVIETNHLGHIIVFLMNDGLYTSLPENVQALVDDCAHEAIVYTRGLADDSIAADKATIEESGTKIITLDSSVQAEMKEKSAGVYDQIREAVGDELVDSLLNAIDAAK